jgi:hypothetical protein
MGILNFERYSTEFADFFSNGKLLSYTLNSGPAPGVLYIGAYLAFWPSGLIRTYFELSADGVEGPQLIGSMGGLHIIHVYKAGKLVKEKTDGCKVTLRDLKEGISALVRRACEIGGQPDSVGEILDASGINKDEVGHRIGEDRPDSSGNRSLPSS